MKNNSNTTIIAIITAIFLFAINGVIHGQDVLYQHVDCNSEIPHIRNYKENIDIVYHLLINQNNPQRFYYIDRSTNTATQFNVPNLDVHDFVIFEDKVYFCGRKVDTAFWGYFDIDSAFFNNGLVHSFTLPQTFNQTGYSLDRFTSMSHIEVYRVAEVVHVVMTGDGKYLPTDKAFEHDASVIFDAILQSGSWSCNYHMDYDERMAYSDIAVVEKNVIVLASQLESAGREHCIVYFDKQQAYNANLSIFATTSNYNIKTTPNSIFSTGGGFITATEHEGFITVCADGSDTNLNNWDYVVSIYDAPYNDPYQRFRFHDGSPSTYGIAYSDACGNLCIVRDDSWCYTYDVRNLVLHVVKSNTNNHESYNTVDNLYRKAGFIIAGVNWNHLNCPYWIHVPNNSGRCVSDTLIQINTISNYQQHHQPQQSYNYVSPQPSDIPVKASYSILKIECQ